MERFKRFMQVYRHADKLRRPWFNAKWRLFVILLLISSVLLVKDYLQNKYIAEFATTQIPVYFVLDKVIYWFLVGIIFGAMTAWLMFEGELAIGLYKSLVHFEKETQRKLGRTIDKMEGKRKGKKRR